MNCFGNNGGSCDMLIWIILLSCVCGNDCGGGRSGLFGGDDNCSCILILLLLMCCGGGNDRMGCGCGCDRGVMEPRNTCC